MAQARPLYDANYNWRHVHADLEAGKLIGNYGGNHVRGTNLSFSLSPPFSLRWCLYQSQPVYFHL